MEIQTIVSQFIVDLTSVIESSVRGRVLSAFGGAPQNGVAKRRVVPVAQAMPVTRMKRRKGPIQLCPAPGCKERAAPVFGMLCKKHKGTPKKVVAKWRTARKAKAAKK